MEHPTPVRYTDLPPEIRLLVRKDALVVADRAGVDLDRVLLVIPEDRWVEMVALTETLTSQLVAATTDDS